MLDIGVPVSAFDGTLEFLYRAGFDHQGHPSALGADQVIVVLLGVEQFVVPARTVQVNLLRQPHFLERVHHAKDRGEIGGNGTRRRSLLDFVQGEGPLGREQADQNLLATPGDPHARCAELGQDRFQGKASAWMLVLAA